MLIQRIHLPAPGLEEMLAEAQREGYKFLDTLLREWESGKNRFDSPGEALCGYLDHGVLLAIGGLNLDPFLNDPSIARIRRVYVREAWRNQGIGAALLDNLINIARQNFRCVRLRADSPRAARLYERKGFVPTPNPSATHIIHFNQPSGDSNV
jgi:hypothetical protein